jgi:acyl carrier protein
MAVEKEKLRRYILENFLFTSDGAALSDADSLMQKGIIDSTGALELIMHLESEYAVKVQDAEMIPANLDSVDAIAAFISRKRAG